MKGINAIAQELVDEAIDVLGSTDNVSVIIVELHSGASGADS